MKQARRSYGCEFKLEAVRLLETSGKSAAQRITDAQVSRIEEFIDDLTAVLPPLSNFILPGGHPVAAHLHQARTVCRRAERRLVQAGGQRELDGVWIRYLNRLADLLFVMARFANKVHGREDEPWSQP